MFSWIVKLMLFSAISFAVSDVIQSSFGNIESYKHRFLSVDAIEPKDLKHVGETTTRRIEMVTKLYKNQISKRQNDGSLTLKKLFSMLNGFQTENCLLLVDNWQNVNIEQTGSMPTILRSLELALSHHKFYFNGMKLQVIEPLLLPMENSLKNLKFSEIFLEIDLNLDCPLSRFYSLLRVDGTTTHFVSM